MKPSNDNPADLMGSKEFKELIRHSRLPELHKLSQQRFNGHVIVYGEPGIGKTSLLELFKETNPVAYLRVTFLRGRDIAADESLLAPFLMSGLLRDNINAFPQLLIIDDFDEILIARAREKKNGGSDTPGRAQVGHPGDPFRAQADQRKGI